MITFCCAQLHRGLASIFRGRSNLSSAQAPGERERSALLRLRLFCNAASLRAAVRRRIFLLVALPMLLLAGLPAQATDYIFAPSSKDLPAGCIFDHGGGADSYTCGVLTLAAGDTVAIKSPKTVTITFTGAFTTGASNLINATGDASELIIVTNGVLTLGDNTMLNANVVGTAAVNLGIGSTIGGNLTASTTTGVVTLAADSRIGGNLLTDAGAVTIGDKGAVGGDITTAAGVVTLTTNVKVGGNITTVAGAITIGNNSAVCGNVSTTGAGVVTLTTNIKVGGNISTTAGGITIGAGSAVGGNVTITGAGVATLTSVQVGGNISTVAGAITLTSSRVGGSVTITGAGVPTLTSSIVNDKTLVISPVCSPTPIPPTLPTCIVDDFASGTLNPALWNALQISGSYTPAVVNKRIRMTTATGNQSTMLQLKKWFPGAGNKITVTFDYYVYGGNGADGVTVVFSDASVAPAPGGFGGSLGYAQRNDPKNGFSGGWLAVGIDEYGNFPNSTEGRIGYPAGWSAPTGANIAAGSHKNNISVRGSGSGTTGYPLLANTGTLPTPIWQNSNTSATVQRFSITIDHTDNIHAYVTVARDGTVVVPTFDAKATSLQAPVPANWLVSFTGGTGGNNNYHEISLLSICATFMNDPGGSSIAGAFECLETGTNLPWVATARKPLYTKLVSTDFKFDIAALKDDGTLESNYVAAGGNSKYAKVELFDDTTPALCPAYANPVASQAVTFASGTYSGAAGRTLTANFKLDSVYKKLRCRVKECTDSTCTSFTSVEPACSSDRFSVRPAAATLVPSAEANAAGAPSATSTPAIKAGATFTLRATTNASSYSGALTLDTGKLTAQTTTQDATRQSGGVVGALTPSVLTANAPAVNAAYSEVGYLYLAAGAYRDDIFTAIDSVTGDCIISTASDNNLADTLIGGKYGCSIGNKTAMSLGRFIPDSFLASGVNIVQRSDVGTCSTSTFTYLGEPFRVANLTLTAKAVGGAATTKNYAGVFGKLDLSSDVANVKNIGAGAQHGTSPTFTNFYHATVVNNRLDAAYAGNSFTDTYASTDPDCPNAKKLAWCKGNAVMSVDLTVKRPANGQDGPFVGAVLGISPSDSDTVKMNSLDFQRDFAGTGAIAADGKIIATMTDISLLYGRLKMQNTHGSELLDLPVPLVAQYWTGKYYATNTADNCTAILPSNITMHKYSKSLNECETHFFPLSNNGKMVDGKLPGLRLTKPGANNAGSVDLVINLNTSNGNQCFNTTPSAAIAANMPWFGLIDPTSRATFGVFKNAREFIYIREMY